MMQGTHMELSGYANLARPICGDVRPFRMKAMALINWSELATFLGDVTEAAATSLRRLLSVRVSNHPLSVAVRRREHGLRQKGAPS
jgi:hypothetical protein